MREIKFRAWDEADVSCYSSPVDARRMSFYGSDFEMDDDQNTLCFKTPKGKQGPFGDHGSMERYKLMQFTGLKDKNGKEIYESDRMKIGKMYWLCFWDDEKARFGFRIHQNGHYIYCRINEIKKKGEVDSNIYENPELE